MPAGAGVEITIRGAGFGGNKDHVAVHLGSTEAKVRQVSNGNIIAMLPGVNNLGDGVADGAWRGERGVRWQWTESKTPANPATVWRERTLQSFDSSDDFSQAALAPCHLLPPWLGLGLGLGVGLGLGLGLGLGSG